MPTQHKRVKSYNTPGHAHELTFSCFRRLPLLNRDRTRQWLLDAIEQAALEVAEVNLAAELHRLGLRGAGMLSRPFDGMVEWVKPPKSRESMAPGAEGVDHRRRGKDRRAREESGELRTE